MKKDYPVQDVLKISDLPTLKTITHPQRIEIIQTLREPKTVKEIAAEIEADPTKLYYHMRQLEGANLIQVVETNIVSGILEKTYYVTAKSYQVDEALFGGEDQGATKEDLSNVINATLQSTSFQAKRSIQAGLLNLSKTEPGEKLNRVESSIAKLTPEQALAFAQKVDEIHAELTRWHAENQNNDQSEVKHYVWTNLFFPMAVTDDE